MILRHILLTTDLSPQAEQAFDPVASLARRMEAKVTLIYAVPELDVAPHGEVMDESTPRVAHKITEATAALEAVKKKLSESLEVEVIAVPAQHAAKAIVDYAKQHDVDLIAMATHGRGAIGRTFLGSVATEVLKSANAPVLCFPPKS